MQTRRPRRGRTLLSRMWSEAQLAVSNGHKHRPRRGRTGFWVARSYGYAVIRYAPKTYNRKCHSPSSRTAYSVTTYRKFRSRWSLHMRLSKVRPLSGTGPTLIRYTPKLRMNPARYPFMMQKATFQLLKGHVLQGERRPFATRWLTACYASGDRHSA